MQHTPYPLKLTEIIEIQFDVAKLDFKKIEIQHKAFSYSQIMSKKAPGVFQITFQLQTHLDAIDANDVSEFSKKLQEAHRESQFFCTKQDVSAQKKFRFSELSIIQKTAIIGFGCMLLRLLHSLFEI